MTLSVNTMVQAAEVVAFVAAHAAHEGYGIEIQLSPDVVAVPRQR
jgi:hypothetical protein